MRHALSGAESLGSVALAAGHRWETLWDAPENARLRSLRRDPRLLRTGDEVFVPPVRPRTEVRRTDKRHRFRRRGAPARLTGPGGPACKLTDAVVGCGHKDRRPKDGVLHVVPEKGGDRIRLRSVVEDACASHPSWEVTGPAPTKLSGREASLLVEDWEVGFLGQDAFAVRDATPRTYTIRACSCTGAAPTAEVRSYPRDEIDVRVTKKKDEAVTVKLKPGSSSVKFEANLWAGLERLDDAITRCNYAVDHVLKPWLDDPVQWKVLEAVEARYSAAWKEHEDHRAFYQYAATVGIDPLFKCDAKIPFSHTAAIPPAIKKWTLDLIGDFYLYLKFSVDVALVAGWSRRSPDQVGAMVQVKGTGGARLGANLFLMRRHALNVDVSGGVGFEFKAQTAHEELAIDWSLEGGEITVEVTVEAMWGLVEYGHETKLRKAGEPLKGRWALDSKEA